MDVLSLMWVSYKYGENFLMSIFLKKKKFKWCKIYNMGIVSILIKE